MYFVFSVEDDFTAYMYIRYTGFLSFCFVLPIFTQTPIYIYIYILTDNIVIAL